MPLEVEKEQPHPGLQLLPKTPLPFGIPPGKRHLTKVSTKIFLIFQNSLFRLSFPAGKSQIPVEIRGGRGERIFPSVSWECVEDPQGRILDLPESQNPTDSECFLLCDPTSVSLFPVLSRFYIVNLWKTRWKTGIPGMTHCIPKAEITGMGKGCGAKPGIWSWCSSKSQFLLDFEAFAFHHGILELVFPWSCSTIPQVSHSSWERNPWSSWALISSSPAVSSHSFGNAWSFCRQYLQNPRITEVGKDLWDH